MEENQRGAEFRGVVGGREGWKGGKGVIGGGSEVSGKGYGAGNG